MNPGAIYSKSGKGVQEASGKTSLLKRAERAVLSAIDGRATLNEVAQKVGKPFDGAFQSLIAQLDRDGFVREVTAGGSSAVPAPAKPAAKPTRSKAATPAPGEDLDFTGIMPIPVQAPAKPAVDPATALFKARKEAEERAAEERERLRAEAEAKARAEAETKAKAEAAQKIREEAAARARADAEAKLKAAAEAKARAEAEAKAKIEAERRAREEAERKAREEAERARREAEELRQRLEEERRAREEAERRAKEEAERKAREEAERKAREEAERKAREEAERARREAEELRQRLEEERRAREEAERQRLEAERKAQEEAERKAQEEAERKVREEAERKARAEQEAQMRRAREEAERKRAEAARKREEAEARKGEPLPEITPPPPAPPPQAAPPKAGGDGLDALMADLDSFTQREDQDRKAREEAENRTREARQRSLQEESEQRAREQAERERRDAEARQREAQERREQEDRAREQAEQRARDEADRQRREAEERARQARESMSARQAQDGADDIGVTDDDLDMDDVRRDEAAVAKESRKARREREREQRRLEKEARERAKSADKAAAKQAKAKARAKGEEAPAVKVRRPRKWGKPVALTLFILLLAGIGLLHVMPVPVQDYQQAASEALRQPVRIGEARLSLYKGLQLNLRNVRIGDGTRIAEMRAFPQIGSLASPVKSFDRIELDGVTLRQDALDESLFASARGPNFRVERILIKDLKLEGPLPLPPLEADVRLAGDGSVRTVLVRGPEGLMGQLMPRAGTVDFDVTAGSFTVPFAKNLALSSFAMKGRATRQGMRIESWGGSALGGALSGTASLRWGGTWQLDGVLTVRGINAAVFAPALLSEGHAEGTGKFAMSGSDPGTLVRSGRVEGNFTIGKGVLGSFDLARAIRTEGREVNGRTPFVELNGLGVYDKGAVALRNVVIGAGALQAGASADISQSGALSGRIVADVRTASQSLRATLLLGGTVKDPQVRN